MFANQSITLFILGLLAGACLTYIFFSRRNSSIYQENLVLKAKLEADADNLDKFKLIAEQVLDGQSAKSGEELKKVLQPLHKDLDNFKNRLEDLNTKRAADNRALQEHIVNLQQSNTQLSEEAANLTSALRSDKKMQGDWGEVILEKLLEQSGLEKGREYVIQKSLKGDDGTSKRPDVIVHLPDEKSIIIDSKVSLVAYADYYNTDKENEQAVHLKKHVQAIDTHIKLLSSKDYEKLEGINTLDYTLMFFPLEGAFLTALKEDAQLFERGLSKNVILVTPSTLLATLKVIHNLWRNERRVQNAQQIATEGGRLFDKFHGFIADMEKIGKSLTGAQGSYDDAMNKLHTGSGNLLGRAQKMKKISTKLIRQKGKAEEVDADDTSITESIEHMQELGVDSKKGLK